MDVENISASGVIEICDGVEEKTSTKWTISSCDRKASEFYETFFKDRKKETGTSKKLVEEKSIERCFNISKLIISDRIGALVLRTILLRCKCVATSIVIFLTVY